MMATIPKTEAQVAAENKAALKFWQDACDRAAQSRSIAGRLWPNNRAPKPTSEAQPQTRDTLASRLYPNHKRS
jgi:hypothetical protein